MKIMVTGRQLDVGDSLREHVAAKLTETISKYANRPIEASAVVSRQAHLYKCDCLAHLSTGLSAQAHGEGGDAYAACDQAVAKLEKQLRRYKRRLKDHHKFRKEPVAVFDAPTYVLAQQSEDEDERGAEDDFAEWRPAIVAETTEAIPNLTVGEAVMQMELKGAPFLLFLNDAKGRLNVVYRRDDGAVGWIDPADS